LSSQFDKRTSNFNYQGLGYDINSIMHYGNYAFSSNGKPTLVAKSGVKLLEAYAKTSISSLDVAALRAAYNCIN
jgi:hypothetical protein